MGRMNPSSYGPTEHHLWLVGKIPPRTCENCKETSERKSRTHSYDELVDLLIEVAMERENDSHMDKYLRKHLQREAPAEKPQGGRSPQPNSNPGKSKEGQLKHMKETPPAKGKGAPNLFYCQPTDDKGGPCHGPDCDGRSHLGFYEVQLSQNWLNREMNYNLTFNVPQGVLQRAFQLFLTV